MPTSEHLGDDDAPSAAKRAARSLIRARRRALDPTELGRARAGLARGAEQLTELASARWPGLPTPVPLPAPDGRLTLAAYLAAPGEPDLGEAMRRWVLRGHRVIVPRCLPGSRMEWVRWTPLLPIGTSALAPVPEPVGGEGVDPAEAALVAVPALAIGADGTRLGQGGGYYDRFLEGLSIPRVGVVYDSEVGGAVPKDPWDAVLDAAWTPSGISLLPFSAG